MSPVSSTEQAAAPFSVHCRVPAPPHERRQWYFLTDGRAQGVSLSMHYPCWVSWKWIGFGTLEMGCPCVFVSFHLSTSQKQHCETLQAWGDNQFFLMCIKIQYITIKYSTLVHVPSKIHCAYYGCCTHHLEGTSRTQGALFREALALLVTSQTKYSTNSTSTLNFH